MRQTANSAARNRQILSAWRRRAPETIQANVGTVMETQRAAAQPEHRATVSGPLVFCDHAAETASIV